MRMAIPLTGPIPGRTPISVPMIDPTVAHMRFVGVRATLKPYARLEKISVMGAFRPLLVSPPAEEHSGRQVDFQDLDEKIIEAGAKAGRDEAPAPEGFAQHQETDGHKSEGGQHVARRFQNQRVGDQEGEEREGFEVSPD